MQADLPHRGERAQTLDDIGLGLLDDVNIADDEQQDNDDEYDQRDDGT